MKLRSIKEVCLYIQDIQQTKHFYHHLLGLPIISEVAGRHIFFRLNGQVLLCFIAETTRKESFLPAHFAYGRQHLAFEVGYEEYSLWKEKIFSLGIDIIHEQGWGEGYRSFYFYDPDFHVLEIVPEGMWDKS